MKVFHHSRFADVSHLVDLKRQAGQRISVCIPTLDEAATIGPIVKVLRNGPLGDLVDEVLVIDSGSTDGTRRIAEENGATVHLSFGIATEHGTHRGKGENLWKALQVAIGDIICFVDGDVSNFHPRFVTGLAGPLLTDPAIGYVKAFYERPQGLHPTGGGRVTEILVRPLLSLFYPALTAYLQPLAGEYAARREVFRSLAFPCGYGVELAHLIDLPSGLAAQVDLDQRVHRNRSDEELGRMAFGILQVLFRRLERDGKVKLDEGLPELLRTWRFEDGALAPDVVAIPEPERPPLDPPRL